MIDNIGVLEGDFQREYRIDLSRSLGLWGLSWRRFRTLVGALSPQSGWAWLAAEAKKHDIGAGVEHLKSLVGVPIPEG